MLGSGVKSLVATSANPLQIYTGGSLLLWCSAVNVTLSGSNVTSVLDMSGNGNSLGPAGTPTYSATGGVKGTPVVNASSTNRLVSVSNISGPIFTMFSVFESGSADIIKAGNLALRYDGARTTSDELTYNNFPAASYGDDSGLHYLATTVQAGTVCPYYLDAVSVPQATPTAHPSYSAGKLTICPSAYPGAQAFHECFVVSGTPTPTQFSQTYAYLNSLYK